MPLLSALSRVSTALPAHINTSGAEVVTSDGRSLPLLGATLRGDAKGGIARLVLEQTFANRFDQPLHVTYRMPLPADGAVSAYEFAIANRVIKGKVDKKQAAREQFERAVASGKTAALLEQNKADIFTQEIGNLPPNQQLVARITVDVRLVWLPEGEWELRFPTVIGPRFVSAIDATEKDARDNAIAVDPAGIAARVQIAIQIGDRLELRKPSSPSHGIKKNTEGLVELDAASALDRDIVIRWPGAGREVGIALDLARKGEDSYGLLTIVPPANAAATVVTPRDLIVLLDTSGSMSGEPLDTAKRVVAMLIESLGEHDRLELIEFSDSPRRYKSEPVAGTSREKTAAITWLNKLQASSSTEMGTAVREAMASLRAGAQRQVVLITDGYVAGENAIVKSLHDGLPKSCRLHVIGIGSAVNRAVATALARAGRGAEVLVGLDEDIERGCKRLLDRTKAPVLTNVEISGSALVRCAPEHVPDVFAGSPVVAALALSSEGGEITVRGELANGVSQAGHPYRVSPEIWTETINVPPRRDGEGNQAIPALYARERVGDLETRWTIGNDQYQIDREIEAVGVEFQIATRLTSWVAIDEVSRVEGPERHEVVPQNLPYGTSAQSFGLRGSMVTAKTMIGGMMPMQAAQGFSAMASMAPMAPSGALIDFGSPEGGEFGEEAPTGTGPYSNAAYGDDETTRAPRNELEKPATLGRKRGISTPPPMAQMAPPPPKQPIAGAPMYRASGIVPAHKMKSRSRSIWLSLVLLLAVIALLIWWLVL
jgi:Ca-activated chloride channel homolog